MKKKAGWIIGSIVLIVAAVIIFWVTTYNSLVRTQEDVNQAKSNISTVLQRRADLIPNLVETVKGYADYEESVFTELADARERMVNGNSLEEQLEADAEATQILRSVFAISENYPELKANEVFIGLQDELAGTENRISNARHDYNEVVGKYNKSIKMFPKSIIANMNGFEEEPYFQGTPGSESVPEVKFD